MLEAGTYTGTLEITPAGENTAATKVNVALTVSEKPYISAIPSSLHFSQDERSESPPPARSFRVETNGSPAELAVEASYESGEAWFSVDPPQATVPAEFTVTVDPSRLEVRNYAGRIAIRGPANEQTVQVNLSVFTRVIHTEIRPSPSPVRFTWQRGSPAPERVRVSVGPIVQPVSFTVEPAPWLSAFAVPAPGVPGIGVHVDPTQLADGVYRSSLTIRSDNPDIIAEPVRLPMELTVWTTPPPLTVSPTSLQFIAGPGNLSPVVTLTIGTGTVFLPYSMSFIPEVWDGAIPVPSLPIEPLTPAAFPLQIQASGLEPGTYTGVLRVISGGSTVDVPVKLVKTGLELRTSGPPTVGAIVNGASQRPGAISPGAIVTLYGFPLAPIGEKSYEVSGGKLTTRLNGTRVLFDGIPAPLLYASPAQINAIVPYEIAGKNSVVMKVEAPEMVPGEVSMFGRSPEQAIPVAAAGPALFTLSGTGTGQAAALNQDNTVNGPQSPAARGSVLQLFATGAGFLSPAPETGAIAVGSGSQPLLPVAVTIGSITAPVMYAGLSAGSVAGLLQVNVAVPRAVPGGNAPVVLTIGDFQTPDGVTVAIR
jgi:uncharacterized protein (TIGR03437 family)